MKPVIFLRQIHEHGTEWVCSMGGQISNGDVGLSPAEQLQRWIDEPIEKHHLQDDAGVWIEPRWP